MSIKRLSSSVLLAVAGAAVVSSFMCVGGDGASNLFDQILLAIEPSLKPGGLF